MNHISHVINKPMSDTNPVCSLNLYKGEIWLSWSDSSRDSGMSVFHSYRIVSLLTVNEFTKGRLNSFDFTI